MVLCACTAEPIYTYESTAPAQVLSPIRTAGIEDGRARFREIFCERFDAIGAPADGFSNCDEYLHRLVDEPPTASGATPALAPLSSLRTIVIPGFMNDLAPGDMRVLGPSIDRLTTDGYQIEYLQVSGGGSAEYNADQIADYFKDSVFPETERLVVIAYSKGALDLMRFVAKYPDLARHVDAVVSYSGAVNGSPLAESAPEYLIDLAGAIGGSDSGDDAGFSDLKPSVQLPWLASHPLPAHIEYFSLASYTNRDHVSAILRDSYDQLSQINAKNDSQLIYYDQVLPGSTLLGYMNGDHWAVVLPFTEKSTGLASTFVSQNVFPRDAMLEAVLLYIREKL
jgi:hypothetical protein